MPLRWQVARFEDAIFLQNVGQIEPLAIQRNCGALVLPGCGEGDPSSISTSLWVRAVRRSDASARVGGSNVMPSTCAIASISAIESADIWQAIGGGQNK